ncbi:uncharacterized protein Z520_04845 [Fonsecaea multimorphosa CBS 102226]|uniref:AB hydrolase-1 domain-containing protein n=1 Tax=Fonsecaea multimorphosa CBS 102226 TaxID=1442371 RepID=A0A0D2K7Y4_9EURO|nr:uncharacterized protein Z520_04845 [Fonsecaea multimorphosa CBS 102226]KIX99269.1 hypothetical protein Z520_04845 [Fonsecaea multimorphosa CBS 102226]OAL25959.1 hypothetical protein AYO22_04586 [Fonsecaea multimorphosa]
MASTGMNVLEHATRFGTLKQVQKSLCTTERLSVLVGGTSVRGFLHLPAGYPENKDRVAAAVILLSGAGGGVVGPSSIYVSIGDKLASLRRGMPVLRLDYRYPAHDTPCAEDVTAAMNHLEQKYSIRKFVLVGWSFGGAPVFTVGGQEKDRVVACATIASQTAGTSGITKLAPRPLLLLHGTGDRTLRWHCSQSLYESYGRKGDRQLKLFENDDHALTRNALEAEELLCDFIANCLGLEIANDEQERVIQKPLVDGGERVELMKKGGDLEGESIE